MRRSISYEMLFSFYVHNPHNAHSTRVVRCTPALLSLFCPGDQDPESRICCNAQTRSGGGLELDIAKSIVGKPRE